MKPLTESEIEYRELNRQLQVSFKEVLRLSREMIKLKTADTIEPRAFEPRPKSRHKQ